MTAYIQGRKDEAEQSSTLAVEKVAEVIRETTLVTDDLPGELARAIVAEFGPLASTREALIDTLLATATIKVFASKDRRWYAAQLADAILASGIVHDEREVRAEQIEHDAQIAEDPHGVSVARAIREQKP